MKKELELDKIEWWGRPMGEEMKQIIELNHRWKKEET